jgi:tRNA nucleotidyltransferase/poly(A) polymerase
VTVTLYEVGGCVRDELLGLKSKDIDFSVIFPRGTYDQLITRLEAVGFERFLPIDGPDEGEASKRCREMLTIRAKFPKGWTFAGEDVSGLAADFVLARKDGDYYDGRHPEKVEMGTLLDDLRRRDFTVNAIAKDETGAYIDPFDGIGDLRRGVLRAVGDAETRIREDALRALRAVRFTVTKGLTMDADLADTLRTEWVAEALSKVVVERRQQELSKAFQFDTVATLDVLMHLPADFRQAVFADGLRLDATLKH